VRAILRHVRVAGVEGLGNVKRWGAFFASKSRAISICIASYRQNPMD
jgi:hypothetical protein